MQRSESGSEYEQRKSPPVRKIWGVQAAISLRVRGMIGLAAGVFMLLMGIRALSKLVYHADILPPDLTEVCLLLADDSGPFPVKLHFRKKL